MDVLQARISTMGRENPSHYSTAYAVLSGTMNSCWPFPTGDSIMVTLSFTTSNSNVLVLQFSSMPVKYCVPTLHRLLEVQLFYMKETPKKAKASPSIQCNHHHMSQAATLTRFLLWRLPTSSQCFLPHPKTKEEYGSTKDVEVLILKLLVIYLPQQSQD